MATESNLPTTPTSKGPALSVVIPAYNRAHCILKTLDSVFEQTYTNYEIIVIDDGSKDNTEEVLRPYFDRLTYIKQENRGLAGTRTRAIELANTDWIAFLDSDDLWLPDNLQTHVDALLADSSLILNTTNALIFREHIGEETNLWRFNGCRDVYSEPQFTLADPLVPYLRFGLLWMQSAVIRKSALEKAGPWIHDLRVWMDFEYGMRLAKLGPWGITMEPKVRILRQDEGEVASISSSSQTIAGTQELARVYEKALSLENLSSGENRFLKRRLSDAQSKLGWKMVAANQLEQGRKAIARSHDLRKDSASLAKLWASRLPGPLGRNLAAKRFAR